MAGKRLFHGNKADIHSFRTAFIHNAAQFFVEDRDGSVQDLRSVARENPAAVRRQQGRITDGQNAGLRAGAGRDIRIRMLDAGAYARGEIHILQEGIRLFRRSIPGKAGEHSQKGKTDDPVKAEIIPADGHRDIVRLQALPVQLVKNVQLRLQPGSAGDSIPVVYLLETACFFIRALFTSRKIQAGGIRPGGGRKKPVFAPVLLHRAGHPGKRQHSGPAFFGTVGQPVRVQAPEGHFRILAVEGFDSFTAGIGVAQGYDDRHAVRRDAGIQAGKKDQRTKEHKCFFQSDTSPGNRIREYSAALIIP